GLAGELVDAFTELGAMRNRDALAQVLHGEVPTGIAQADVRRWITAILSADEGGDVPASRVVDENAPGPLRVAEELGVPRSREAPTGIELSAVCVERAGVGEHIAAVGPVACVDDVRAARIDVEAGDRAVE